MIGLRGSLPQAQDTHHMATMPYTSTDMIEPSHVTKLVRRKSSFDEYQRRLVEKIKRHFERRRRQWERNIDNQVGSGVSRSARCDENDAVTPEVAEDQLGELPGGRDCIFLRRTQRYDEEEEEDEDIRSACRLSDRSRVSLHGARSSTTTTAGAEGRAVGTGSELLELLSCERTEFPDEARTKHTLHVNIRAFLAAGSVTVHQGTHGLTLIGENCGGACCSRSRGRRGSTRTHERDVDLDAPIETDSMHVRTTRDGVMRIDVVTTYVEESS